MILQLDLFFPENVKIIENVICGQRMHCSFVEC